MIRLQL